MKKLLKRIFDIAISLSVAVILLPVFVVIAIAVKLTSKGPVIFKQQRAGKDGKPFVFYKFRTMKLDVGPFRGKPKIRRRPSTDKSGKVAARAFI